MKKELHRTIEKAVFLLAILLVVMLQACNPSHPANQQNKTEQVAVPDTTLYSEHLTDSAYAEIDSELDAEGYLDDPSDSVMARGNHVIFFMQDGEWANEIGAEETVTNFTEHALDAIDELKNKGYNTSFLIGETIKIGLENGPSFTIDDPECVLGVVFTKPGSDNRLECGISSATDFWNYFNEYYKPQL